MGCRFSALISRDLWFDTVNGSVLHTCPSGRPCSLDPPSTGLTIPWSENLLGVGHLLSLETLACPENLPPFHLHPYSPTRWSSSHMAWQIHLGITWALPLHMPPNQPLAFPIKRSFSSKSMSTPSFHLLWRHPWLLSFFCITLDKIHYLFLLE